MNLVGGMHPAGSENFPCRQWLQRRSALACLAGLLLWGWVPPAVAAGRVFWDYPEGVPFAELELDGMALDRYGRLTAGLAAEKLVTGGPEVFWRLLSDESGGLYGASGHGGQVWFLDSKDNSRPLTVLPEPEIFSLLRVGKYLFAGGGPDGHLYRIDRDGEAEVWADLHENYIWALAEGSEGQIYLAAGSPATLYIVTGRLEVERLVVLPAANALDLVVTADGSLLVATQGPGMIYRLDPAHPDQATVLYETDQEEVRQFAAGPDGAWYALAISRSDDVGVGQVHTEDGLNMLVTPNGMVPNGEEKPQVRSALYRLGDNGLVTRQWAGEQTLLSVAHSVTWGWLGGGVQSELTDTAALLALEFPGGARPLATWDAGDVLDLIVQGEKKGSEVLYICMAHPGRIMRLQDRPAEAAVAMSEPIDGGQPIRWGRLRWEGTVPRGGGLRWSVRGGPRSVPDQTWTEWSEAWFDRDHPVPLSPSRFLQWRVEIAGKRASITIAAVTVSGYEPNGSPEIFRFDLEPEGEMFLGGLLSRDENVTESFKSGLKVEYNIPSRQSRRADLARAAPARPLRTFTWIVTDPNDDRLEFRVEYQRLGEETWRPVGPDSQESIVTWDSSTVPDGRYVMRLTANDRPANPQHEALSTSRLSAPFIVDHTPPELTKFSLRRTEDGFALAFKASDATSPLAEAWLELPDGTSERLDPTDAVCDSQEETFDQAVLFPRADQVSVPEPWRVRVEVADRYGNVASEEGEVR